MTEELMKKWIIAIVILIIAVAIFGFGLYKSGIAPVSNSDEQKKVTIKAGENYRSIAPTLKQEGLIKSEFFYKVYLKLNKNQKELKAGTYLLSPNMGVATIVQTIQNENNNASKTITFPEGKNMRYIAKKIAENTSITEEEVFNKLKDMTYIDSLIQKYWFLTDEIKNANIYYPLEGYLFPETYQVEDDVTLEELFTMMLDQMNKVLTENKAGIEANGFTVHQIVTLASVIESEGVNAEDRGNIASTFYNRLNKKMALESDVTTYYAAKVAMGERDLYTKELNSNNPYNTRGPNMAGKLPVGAISNPGKESIQYAITPPKTEYLYFVADKDRKVHFTKTYAEHLKLIEQLKQEGKWFNW